MPHCDLPKRNREPETNDMRLPQSLPRSFSIRVFFILSATLFAAMLPLSAGAATQQLTCVPGALHFGVVAVGQSETQLVVLTNTGQASVTVSAFTVTGAGFTLSNSTFPLTLAAGQSVSLNVTFAPTSDGWVQGIGTFTSTANNTRLQLQLRGTGAASESIVASPPSVSFGQVAVGGSSTVPVVLTNTRSSKVQLLSLQTSGNGYSVSGPTFPVTLSSGQSVTLNLTFAPISAGITGGDVFVTGPNLNVPMNGTGTTTTAGKLTITPSLVNFGNVPVGTTTTQPITMSASGASVTVTSDASSSSQFVLQGASLPFTIPAGQSSSFNVAFTPQSTGTISGSLSFVSNASTTQTYESLTGDGTSQQYSVNLYWNASSDVVGYNVYRSTSSNGTYSKINSALDPNTSYTDNSVSAGATYYYEATAVNAAGEESARSTPPVSALIP